MIQSALFRVLQIRMNVDREESFPRSKFFTADTDMPLLFAKVCCDMLQCSRSRRNIDATSAKIESMLPIIIMSSLRTVDAAYYTTTAFIMSIAKIPREPDGVWTKTVRSLSGDEGVG